jgi:hypothetical protein
MTTLLKEASKGVKITVSPFINYEEDLKIFAKEYFALRELNQVKEVNQIISEAFKSNGFDAPLPGRNLTSFQLDILKGCFLIDWNLEGYIWKTFLIFGINLIKKEYAGF